MSIGDAKVTLNLSDVNKLQGDLREANARALDLEKQIDEASLGDHEGPTRQYQRAFLDAMQVVRFAIGSLDPLTVRGWPYKELFSIVDHLRSLPGIDGDQAETAGDLKLFAQNCERWEKARDDGREQAMLTEENSARAPVIPS